MTVLLIILAFFAVAFCVAMLLGRHLRKVGQGYPTVEQARARDERRAQADLYGGGGWRSR